MKFRDLIPGFVKPALRPIYRTFLSSRLTRKIVYRPKDLGELHHYWQQPENEDRDNLAQDYLIPIERSQFLLEIIKQHQVKPEAKVLEIGCNVGRNLNYLFSAGFRQLSGIEINETAVQLLTQAFPEMASQIKIYNSPVEKIISNLQDGEFDVVYTMAVLEHIHADSEWIFPEMVRITKCFLITIEDEVSISWRHFPRHYQKVFESLGMKQIEEIICTPEHGLNDSFFARTFKKV